MHTRGRAVCRWIEAHCVVPDGPLIGSPFIIPDFRRRTIYEWYEMVPDGYGGLRRRYSQGLIGVAPLVIILGVAFCLGECPPPDGAARRPSVWDGYPGILK